MESTEFVYNAKEGIDNPAMVVAEDAEIISGPTPRVCMLKREEGETFGFHVREEKGQPGHVIRKVELGGMAERSGLRDGDRLLEVNEHFVDDLEHMEVAHRIQISGSQLCLLVLSSEQYEQAVAQGWNLKEVCRAQRGDDWRPPRLCHFIKDPVTGLGLSILPVDGEKGKFTLSPVSGGSAIKAGVVKGDRLVWINGVNAGELTNSAISKMVKKCSDHMTVLLIDSKSEKTYARRKMTILPAMADAQSLPHRPRKVHLEKGPDGYGFLLRQETLSAGRKVHVVREVDAGSPADKAGIKDGELLLEVNGESTDHLSHHFVVNRIRDSGQQVSFTTITRHGQDFYTKLGLSPLLFCEGYFSGNEQQNNLRSQEQSPSPLKHSVVSAEAKEKLEVKPTPRMCVLQRGPVGFGFHLGFVQQKPGTFISQVTAGGPGESSGLLQGDVLVEVNGENVEGKYLEDVILLMKNGGDSLSLLVIDQSGYERMKSDGTPVTSENQRTAHEVKNNESPSPQSQLCNL